MTITEVVDIILTIAIIAVCALSAYRTANNDIYSKVAFLIAEAAKLDLLGAQKMQRVVDELYKVVPVAFRQILTREKLETIAQGVYDSMKAFAVADSGRKDKTDD